MATFSVTDQTRRAQYTANGSTTEFSFSFQVNNTSDIKVDVNGTTKTESTHYDIKTSANSNGLNTDGTGKVVFRTSPSDHTPANNEIVTIYSDHPLSRTSVYTSGGNITAASLENDFDTITMVLGSHEERMNRAIQAPVTDPVNVDLTLPIASTRASKIMGFDANGDFVVDSSSSLSLVFDTVTIGTILATSDLEFQPSGGQVNILGTSGQQRITFNNDSTPTIDIYQNSNITTLAVSNPSANRTITFPDTTGTVALTSQLDLVNDTTPQLGGTLDLNGNRIEDDVQVFIKGTGSADIDLQAAGGQVNILDGSGNQRITFNNDGTPSINTFGAFSIDGDNTIDINSTGDFTVDSSGDIILDADGGEIYLKDGGTTKFTFRVSASGNRILGDSATTIETSAGAIDIKSATGNVDFLTNSGAQSIQLQSTTTPEIRFYQNSYTLDVDVATLSGIRTLTLPDATDTLVGKATTDTLTNKTLTSAVLNTSVSGTAIKDEDTMSSNSPNHLATQQSIKAYVDSRVATVPTGDITGVIAGTGISGGGTSGTVTLNINATTGLTATSSTLSIDSTVVTKTGSQTLTNKTLTSPVLNTGVSGTAIKDEDTMVSNSSSHLATQQSIKAYVDAQVAGGGAGNLSTVLGIGNTTAGNNIVFGDSSGASDDRLTFGADADLQIYHDGSSSLITDTGSGNLTLTGSSEVTIENAARSQYMLRATDGGDVKLFHNGSEKIATTSTGVDVTGRITTDGITSSGTYVVESTSYFVGNATNGYRFNNAADTSNLLVIKDSGNVGIGTASPVTKLQIKTQTDGNAAFQNSTSVTGGVKINAFNDAANASVPFEIDGSSLQFNIASVEKMRIDSSGNVGIGTTSPLLPLHVSSSGTSTASGGNAAVTIRSEASGRSSTLQFSDGTIATWIGQVSGSNLNFGTDNTERMRIDSSGNLLVGKTSVDDGATTGVEFKSTGETAIARSSGSTGPLYINRISNDGNIVTFAKDGSTVGSIGSRGGADLYIGSGDTNFKFAAGSDAIVPATTAGADRDNAIDLGVNTVGRFDDIFATNGTIQTSDEREKQQIASLTDAEMAAAKAISKLFKTFKWNDKVEAKGDAARTHTGVIAQQVETAMSDAGLDAGKYAFFISTTWWEADDEVYNTSEDAPEGATERNRKGIRYPELLSFIGAATEQRLTSIESRLDALEAN